MYALKQSTAIDIPFFAHDSAGDAVTGLTNATFTAKRISKAGGAFATIAGAITEMEGGWYTLALAATDTATNGILTIYLTHNSIKQVNMQFRVETRLADDLAWPTVSGRPIDVWVDGTVGLDFTNTNGTLAKTTHITGFNDLSAAQVNAEVDSALNTAIPGSPTAGSVNERIATMDDAYTAARGGYLDRLNSYVDASLSTILADTAELQGDWADGGRLDLLIDTLVGDTTDIQVDIAALENLSAAQVNAEVVDALATDTYAEPGAGAPAATTNLAAKLGYLYKGWRNRKTATTSLATIYNDDATTSAHTATLVDNGTFDHGEWGA